MANDGCTTEASDPWHGAMRYPVADLVSIAWIDDPVDWRPPGVPSRAIAQIGDKHVVFGLVEGGFDGVFIATENVIR